MFGRGRHGDRSRPRRPALTTEEYSCHDEGGLTSRPGSRQPCSSRPRSSCRSRPRPGPTWRPGPPTRSTGADCGGPPSSPSTSSDRWPGSAGAACHGRPAGDRARHRGLAPRGRSACAGLRCTGALVLVSAPGIDRQLVPVGSGVHAGYRACARPAGPGFLRQELHPVQHAGAGGHTDIHAAHGDWPVRPTPDPTDLYRPPVMGSLRLADPG
jgi:hypothetical protein